jgi:hypothetical protein
VKITIINPTDQRYNESCYVEIACLIEGYPLPEIEWKSNKNQVLETVKRENLIILVFRSIKPIDSGDYTCRMKDNSLFESINLIVQCNILAL